ncbi:endoplasmic reticulum protein [Irpex rosettiformis]|uniref:Endoplasmic reticulum protein n=1 Tax=Irpex rosettiformis TaxID=378272 RepID=A0ACB8UE03_9APHY|nr:endoplasmic reticulum protein [Irpex rosettiformis]
MIPWIFLALAVSPVFSAVDKTHGVPPDLLPKYTPLTSGASPTWKCLDGSKEIKWSAVNDDYCDCADGSDEPGTGACPDTRFYCKNEGHIGAFIPSSRVNDGLCETSCCDGSDEKPGVCPNKCKEIGDAYKAKMVAEQKLRKTGSKIRSSYITFAHKEKTRLEAEIAAAALDIAIKQEEVDHLKDLVERTESLSTAALEQKKQSPLYQTLLKHHHALESLQREYKKHLEREKTLGDILDTLRTGYNPNYQDMAVLNAVRGWEYIAGLPHINDVGKDQEEEEDNLEELGSDDVEGGEAVENEEGLWTAEELDRDLPGLLASNYESLLLEHEKHVGAPTTESLLFDLSAYIPDALLPQYESFRDNLVSWLRTLGVIKGSSDGDAAGRVLSRTCKHVVLMFIFAVVLDASRSRQALDEAERNLATATKEKSKSEESLSRLFNPEWFGREGEFKKLDNTCLEKNMGDYTYEVCLFGEAKQKPNNGGSHFSLGRFAHWNNVDGIDVGSPEYYSKMFYTRGTRCWNGPDRTVVLVWTCGTENALISVQELEKCEYQFTGTSPALCLPPDVEGGKRDEL